MKVCYFIPMLDYATGWGRWTVDLLECIAEHGVEPVLILPESQRKVHAETSLKEYETHFWGPEPYLWFHQLHRINFRGMRDLLFVKKEYTSLIGKGISLIHAADMYPWGYFAKQLKETLNVPVILTNHSKLLFNPWFSVIDSWLCKKAVNASDKVVSVSDWSRNLVQKQLGTRNEKFVFIHNGVNIDKLKVCKDTTDRKMNLERHGPVILSVTRFIPQKGLETSVLAFRKIKEAFPGAKYYIIGPHTHASYFDLINQIIKDNDIKDVYAPGKTTSFDELCGYYRMADVLLHTSKSESFGLIFYEAGYFGLPVVAAGVGGVPEVIINNENGLLVPSGDVDATYQALGKILADPDYGRLLGSNNRARSMACTTREVAAKYYKLYSEMVQTG